MPITETTLSTGFAPQAQEPVQPKSKTLGQEDFFKILVAQLTTQDPLKPMGDAEFIGQMAQFSQLESSREMMTELQTMRTQQDFLKASSLIGKEVQFEDGENAGYVGTVTGLEVENGEARLVAGSKVFTIGQVVRIGAGAAGENYTN